MPGNRVYLITANTLPAGAVEIFTSKFPAEVGAPIKYAGAFGETYGHVTAVYETEENGDLHNWLKASAGTNVSIFPKV